MLEQWRISVKGDSLASYSRFESANAPQLKSKPFTLIIPRVASISHDVVESQDCLGCFFVHFGRLSMCFSRTVYSAVLGGKAESCSRIGGGEKEFPVSARNPSLLFCHPH